MFRLTRLSLANRALVALVTLLIAAFGVFSMTSLKQELIPSIEFPQTTVVTTLPGASPDVVDEQVGLPLSQAFSGLPDVEDVIATSSSSVSTISISYTYGTDAKDFQASVTEAIDSVRASLPEDAEPELIAGSVSSLPIMAVTASSDQPIGELSTELDEVVVPELEAVDGVREVTVSGGETQRVTIAPDPAALAAAGLSSQDVASVLEANGVTLPAGTLEEGGELLPVQGGSALTSLSDLESLPLASTTAPGTVVSLGSVADVALEPETATSLTRINGEDGVSLSITATQDADIVSVSHAVDDVLEELRGTLGDGISLTVAFSQAPFVEESIQHLAIEGALGLVFAIVVILVFLLSVRSTLVTAISIPVSVLVTFIGLNVGGYSLNMLTLGALTIAIGRVVDDSIVVIENIKRHLSYGEDKVSAILTAVREVAGAITASTLTTVAVFLPIALVGGIVGELFSPFAMTVTIAMLSSLIVALTIVPVLSYWFLKQPAGAVDPERTRIEAEEKESRSRLQRAYAPVLRSTQKHPVVTLVSSALLLVITVSLLPLLKVDFLGSTGQNSLSVSQEFSSGADLETITDGVAVVEEALDDVDGIEDVLVTATSAAGGGGGLASLIGGGSGTASYTITTTEDADQAVVESDVRDAVADVTGAGTISVSAGGGTGFASTVDVAVTAADDADLADAAEAVYAELEDVDGATEVSNDLAGEQPTLQITVDRTRALEAGLTEIQVLGIAASALSPQSIGSLTIDGDEYSIYVDTDTAPTSVEELEQLQLPTALGLLPLSELADVDRVEVAPTVTREGGELVATISLTPEEGELGALTTAVTERLDGIDLPEQATASVGGASELQQESFGQLGLAMLAAIAIVFLLLVATFRSLLQPIILLVSIPFAATGAIALLLATGRPLGVSALIGMLMLIGIVVTNAIVLIDLVNQYRRQGQSVHDAVFNGARQRLRPILMTALATIFALTPMALGVTGSSGFISQDLAIVVIGGLISSTLLTLVLVPVLYVLVEGRRTAKHAGGDDAPALDVDRGDRGDANTADALEVAERSAAALPVGAASPDAPTTDRRRLELVGEVRFAREAKAAALRRGDWAGYGEADRRIEDALAKAVAMLED
jgi:HAE1 family hydrophobic/amphiphilic exporter-1